MVVNEVLRVTQVYSQPGASEQLCVFNFRLSGTDVADSAVHPAVEVWMQTLWKPDWITVASPDAKIVDLVTQVMNLNGTVNRNIGTGLVDIVGTNPGEPMPAGVAALLQAPTSLPKQRAKKYIPGLVLAGAANGVWTAGIMAELVGLLDTWLDGITVGAGHLDPGVLSTTLTQFVPLLGTGTTTDIPAYQRRRKPNVGS